MDQQTLTLTDADMMPPSDPVSPSDLQPDMHRSSQFHECGNADIAHPNQYVSLSGILPQSSSPVSSESIQAGFTSEHSRSLGSQHSTNRSMPADPAVHPDPSPRDVILSHVKHSTDVDEDVTLDKFPIPPSMPSPANPKIDKLTGSRIFLDICCGVNSPLSTAVQNLKGDIMRFDILVHSTDDLLDSTRFEQLLRVCASGIVAYAGASPSCCEYSRLKLLPNGPPALRTPTHLDGVPGISGQNLLRVRESSTMLLRCIQCLQVVVSSGGHGHLEQPKTAMSWSEPAVQQFPNR